MKIITLCEIKRIEAILLGGTSLKYYIVNDEQIKYTRLSHNFFLNNPRMLQRYQVGIINMSFNLRCLTFCRPLIEFREC